MMDTPSITGDDPQEVANKEIQKYICIDANPTETLVVNGGKHTVHNYLFCLLWHGNIYAFQLCMSVPFSVAGNIVNSKDPVCFLKILRTILTFKAYNLHH